MLPPLTVVCPVCGRAAASFAPGPGGREAATCRGCACLERHRFLALLLDVVSVERPPTGLVLDVAPSLQMSGLIRGLRPQGYLSIDFDPAADGRLVDVAASLTHLPARDASTGLLVCYHVLEHVPDDRRAMAEIARVLTSDGVAIIQVPWRDGPTDEDPSASPEERLRRFGQVDHVRYYGVDFEDRLVAAGLDVLCLRPSDVLPDRLIAQIGAMPGEQVWLCTPQGSAGLDLDGVRARMLDAVSAMLARVLSVPEGAEPASTARESELAWARADAEKWQRAYTTLRDRWPVRVMAAASRPFTRGRAG